MLGGAEIDAVCMGWGRGSLVGNYRLMDMRWM